MGWMGPYVEKDNEKQYMGDFAKARRLLQHLLRYKKDVVLVAITIFVSTAVSMTSPYVLGLAVNGILGRNIHDVYFFSGLYAALYIFNYVFEGRRTYLMPVLAQRVIKDLRDMCFDSIQKVEASFYTKKPSGRIISNVTNDAEALSDFLTFQLPQVLAGLTAIVGSIGVMVYLDPSLTLVSLTIIPVLAVFSALMQRRVRERFFETRRKIAAVTANFQEVVGGVKVVKSFAREEEEARRFDKVNSENLEVNLKASKLSAFYNSMVQIIEAIGIAIVLFFGAKQVLASTITVGILVSFVLYVQNFFNPVLQLSLFYNSYQSAMTGLDRVYRLIDEGEKVTPKPNLLRVRRLKGQVEFVDVRFGYDGREVLHGVSFIIPAGSKVALIGPTGAGKTTVVNILLKFYEPSAGRVLVDGIDITQIDAKSFREHVAVVFQESILFEGSVMDNIRLGNPALTEDEIKRLMVEYGLDPILSKLSEGYSTRLSERGSNISEGQKQLIGLARAIVKQPAMLILDEATSQLDPHTERVVQQAVMKLMQSRSVLIVAHRLSTIMLCDSVVYLNDGRVVTQGPPLKVLQDNPKLMSMYKYQTAVDEG
ncbi:MAG: ABC transporter ATP-binding protein [Thermoprotei archaeon]